jgi:hypothetical protein
MLEKGTDFDLFCTVLGILPTGQYHKLFNLYDRTGQGYVDMKAFLLGLFNFVNLDKDEKVRVWACVGGWVVGVWCVCVVPVRVCVRVWPRLCVCVTSRLQRELLHLRVGIGGGCPSARGRGKGLV